jgi:hypothetical protein
MSEYLFMHFGQKKCWHGSLMKSLPGKINKKRRLISIEEHTKTDKRFFLIVFRNSTLKKVRKGNQFRVKVDIYQQPTQQRTEKGSVKLKDKTTNNHDLVFIQQTNATESCKWKVSQCLTLLYMKYYALSNFK